MSGTEDDMSLIGRNGPGTSPAAASERRARVSEGLLDMAEQGGLVDD